MTVQYVSEFAVNHIDDSKLTFWVSLKPKTFLISLLLGIIKAKELKKTIFKFLKIFKTKLVSSTLRTVAVKLVYSPTRLV